MPIFFPVLRSRRLTVQLHEIPIGDALDLAAMPGHLDEACCTAFLRAAVASAKGIEDPSEWTVQERMLAVCHYLAATTDDGPDFSVGKGKYSDYLEGAKDVQSLANALRLGEVAKDYWGIRHLTGGMAESIERLVGEIPKVAGRLHWLIGAMAAQLVRDGEAVPTPADGEGAFDEYLLQRMQILLTYPGSDFQALMLLYLEGRAKLAHLFEIDFNDEGIVVMPKGGVASELPPARFPIYSCLPRLALELVGKHDELGL